MRGRTYALSQKELQRVSVISSLAKGDMACARAAELLSLSDKTISTYRARILEKMDLKNNAELTHYAIQNRLTG